MNTTELFGIQFALKNRFKAQIIEDFDRWKSEKQWFLTEELNKRKLFDGIVKKHREDYSRDYRSPEEIAWELWEKLKVRIARTNWQQVYYEELGSNYELPRYDINAQITVREIKELLFEYNCKQYYFTKSAVQECEKVHITEPLDMEWLRDSSDGKRQLNFGDQFIRYTKQGNRIIALAASFTRRQEHNYLQHTFLNLNLKKQESHANLYDPIADLIRETCERELNDYPEAFDNKSRMLLYKMVTFLDLIPLKQLKLPAGKFLEADSSSGDAGQPEPINNNGNIPLTIVTVNPNWNCSLFIEETNVTGHFRNIPCGKGRSKIVRKFVKAHHRKEYERTAPKLRAEDKRA